MANSIMAERDVPLNMTQDQLDYYLYRGKCKEYSEKLVAMNPGWTMVRGFYHCPITGTKEAHWWCKTETGMLVDPTARQFASKGAGEYEEFDGFCECEICGKKTPEAETVFMGNGNHTCCSNACAMELVGLTDYQGE